MSSYNLNVYVDKITTLADECFCCRLVKLKDYFFLWCVVLCCGVACCGVLWCGVLWRGVACCGVSPCHAAAGPGLSAVCSLNLLLQSASASQPSARPPGDCSPEHKYINICVSRHTFGSAGHENTD